MTRVLDSINLFLNLWSAGPCQLFGRSTSRSMPNDSAAWFSLATHLLIQEKRELVAKSGLSLEGCEEGTVLDQRAAQARALELQQQSLSKPPPAPRMVVVPADAGSAPKTKRQKVSGSSYEKKAAEKKAALERREEERRARDEAKARERALEKARKEEIKQRKDAEREAEKAKKEEERLAKFAEKESERLRREEERKAKEQEKEAERQRKEKAREAELAKAEAAKKRQSIMNFLGGKSGEKAGSAVESLDNAPASSPKRARDVSEDEISGEAQSGGTSASTPAKGSLEAMGDVKQIFLRDGKRQGACLVIPPAAFDKVSQCKSVLDMRDVLVSANQRAPSCGAAQRYLSKIIDVLSKRAEGQTELKLPRLPLVMRMLCRREGRSWRRKNVAVWQWAPMKTLSFHEDERPAYLGTFTRPSVAVAVASTPTPETFPAASLGHSSSICLDINGTPFDADKENTKPHEQAGDVLSRTRFGDGSVSRRRPFGQDATIFDYEVILVVSSVMEWQQDDSTVFWQVDSEAEWEPEGDGEDLGSEVDGDEKEEEDAMQDDEQVKDDWLVKDDAPEGSAPSGVLKSLALTPSLVLGPLLSGTTTSISNDLEAFTIQLLNDAAPPSAHPPNRKDAQLEGFPTAGVPGASSSAEALSSTPATKGPGKAGRPVQRFPAHELPRLAMLVHGNPAGLAKIIAAFLDGLEKDCPKISRAQVELEIRAMATKDTELQGKSCWRVLPDMVQKFGLSTPCPAQSEMPVAKAKKRKAAELQSAQGMPMNATQPLNTSTTTSNDEGVVAADEQMDCRASEDTAVKTLFAGDAVA
ncbi:MAG: hypothetical protein SGPRY_009361 [Prymnesium sp.]